MQKLEIDEQMPPAQAASFGDGNDAVAWAAQDAGAAYISHYPGSPVNRVVDVLQQDIETYGYLINHALNEHIAALSVMGASLCGARSLLVMKHVGLNIAADPLNYAGVIKIKGGLVVLVGTDPGARTSTGEEDVHWYAPQFNLPLLEPVSVQHLYAAVIDGFEISEQLQLPVLVFVPGRLAYQSSLVARQASAKQRAEYRFQRDPENLINVGNKAVRNHRDHLLRLAGFQRQSSRCSTRYNPHAQYGVVTRGASYAVCCEVIESLGLEARVELLNIEQTFPLNVDPFVAFARHKQEILIVEDQDGFLETMIKREAFGQVTCPIQGKHHFPAWGEIDDRLVREFFSKQFELAPAKDALSLQIEAAERPGSFCEGCPHRSVFYAIDKALAALQRQTGITGVIGGDIGCSSLPPHRTDWLLCMNAGVGLAQGIAHLLPEQPLVSTGGEGSLFHGGLISLQSAVENGINLTHLVLDNQTVAMTGHQDSPTTSGKLNLPSLLQAIGVEHVFAADAFSPQALAEMIEAAVQRDGVKVIHVRGGCAQRPNEESLRRLRERTLEIINNRCRGCSICYDRLQCPAIDRDEAGDGLQIDLSRCRRCAACLDVCPNNAIQVTDPLCQ